MWRIEICCIRMVHPLSSVFLLYFDIELSVSVDCGDRCRDSVLLCSSLDVCSRVLWMLLMCCLKLRSNDGWSIAIGLVDVAGEILFKIIRKFGGFSWTSRGGMVAMRLEASSGFTSSMLSPHILPQVWLSDPIEKHMMTFEETKPLRAELALEKVVMRFFSDSVVPVVDEWGSCVGLLHRVDCDKLDALISTMMRGPPPCVSISTSIGRVMNLILEKKYEVVVVVRSNNVNDTRFGSIPRPVGAFTRNKLFKLAFPSSEVREPWLSKNSDRLQSPRCDSEAVR